MVRHEQRLLIRFVPHHKVQGGGALMREDMLVSTQQGGYSAFQLVCTSSSLLFTDNDK